MYVHILAWPYKHLHLDGAGFVDRVEYAQLLNDASEVPIKGIEAWQQERSGDAGDVPSIAITLPQSKPDVAVPVVELFLK